MDKLDRDEWFKMVSEREKLRWALGLLSDAVSKHWRDYADYGDALEAMSEASALLEGRENG